MRLRRAAGVLALALVASACSPKTPEGVDKAALDAAVSRAVGDPGTCVLIGEAGSGKLVYRYNTHMTCGRSQPRCDKPNSRTVEDLLKTTAVKLKTTMTSCDSTADGTRSVGWAAGPIAGRDLVYAAMMEGERSFPGRIMADRLARAFRDVGLSETARTGP